MLTIELNTNLDGETFLKSVRLSCLPNKNDIIREGEISFFVHLNDFVVIKHSGFDGSDAVIGTKLDIFERLEGPMELTKKYLEDRGWQGQGCLL